MCLFTHFAAGALAGGATGNPVLGLAAGVVSHAVLDAVPHYDHPDWRLELTGGLLSLVLLLLMPFASLAAVLGGVGGMLPDLENLFQKLGKMRRDQFVFPSHTGLVPHGRTLGPRSLVWQVAIFVVCFGLLGMITPPGAAAAAPAAAPADHAVLGQARVQVLEAGQDVTRLRVEVPVTAAPDDWSQLQLMQVHWSRPYYVAPEGGPDAETGPPRLNLPVAVPTTGAVQVTVSGLSWWKEPDAPVAGSDLVEAGRPAVYRSVPLAGCVLALGAEGGVLRSALVEISHPAGGVWAEQLRLARDFKAAGKVDRWTEPVPPGLHNPELFQALARGGRERAMLLAKSGHRDKGLYNHFDLTSNWIRLEVNDTGIYRLTGQDLSGLGLATEEVDPGQLRVFQGGGLHLDPDPTLAEAEQVLSVGLTEIPIQVLDGDDGEWNLDDEIRFYGFGSTCWRDRLDPAAGILDHYEHPFAGEGVYWLTWQSLADVSPLPGDPLRIAEAPAVPAGAVAVDRAVRRVHAEQSNVDAAGKVADNWAWDVSVYSTRKGSFELYNPVPDSLADFTIDFRGNPSYGSSSTYVFAAAGWLNGDTAAQATTSFTRAVMDTTMRTFVSGRSGGVFHGENEFTLENTSTTPRMPLALDSFDIRYWAGLDTRNADPVFDLVHPAAAVEQSGQVHDIVLTVSDAQNTLVWDVTDAREPRLLIGQRDGNVPQTVTVGVVRDQASDLHLVVQDTDDLLQVAGAERAQPVDLRGQSADLDYIVIYPEPFAQAAQTLADFHSQHLVGIGSPAARAVLIQDIYDNFSGGRKDVMALRNYLRHVFEAGHRLRYVCLLGNASRDYRNYRGHTPYVDLVDFVPGQLRTYYPYNATTSYSRSPYSSDDGLVSFDPPPFDYDLDYPDLATGRLPAMTVAEANAMVQVMIDFQTDLPEGNWRNNFLMVSDDCNVPSHYPYPTTGIELSHYLQAEDLTGNWLASTLDIHKIYGMEYDFPPGSMVKPQVRADINAALNAGTTVYHYVGHGAEDNLADEQVFQSRDIANLTNGLRRPLFVAFSCDVGVYDNPIRRSMAELFLASEGGGAIGSICASQVSFIYQNNTLSEAFYSSLYPGRQVPANVTVSAALMQAKAQMTTQSYRANSQRFNLISDPGLRLPNPVSELEFAAASADTLRAGSRQVVAAGTGSTLLGAGDSYDLLVRESAYDKSFVVYDVVTDYTQNPPQREYIPTSRTFFKLGSTVFRGSGTMDGDDLSVPFKVPSQLRYGDHASVRLVVGGPDVEQSAKMTVPAVRSSTGPVDDVLGPQIALSLPNRFRVRPGDVLSAAFHDTSGIAILGTSPGNSILLEFDNTGFMTEITESFAYDPNSYTTGQVSFPLPADISTGSHKAAIHASDALGNVGSDTLSFTVAEYAVTGIRDVTVFPNPTPGPCRLVFDLTDPMQVQWDIYTLSGRRLQSLRQEFGAAGPGIITWDGRDAQGDEIANGTYLFVLRGRWSGDEGRELKQTGKLVIMR